MLRGGAADLPPRHAIDGVRHVWQKWNNCGPSAVLMAASAHEVHLDQLSVAAQLKPDREDTNVTPEELAAFARSQGLGAVVRLGGHRQLVRRLVAAGVPVIAEQWIDVEGRGEMGHYRVVTGYDDGTGEVVTQDSYYGPGRRYGYDDLEAMWRPFLGAYVAVYAPAQEGAVRAALGADWDPAVALARVRAAAEAAVTSAPDDAWRWFELGEARARTGAYAAAVEAFERAVAIGLPERAFWYQFGFYRALDEAGAYERLLRHAEATIATMHGENLEESHYWRGVALGRLGDEEGARTSFRRALAFNPLFAPAQEALAASDPRHAREHGGDPAGGL